MSGAIQGPLPPAQGPQQNSSSVNISRLMSNIESATQAVKDASLAFDTESQGVSRSQLGAKPKSASETSTPSKSDKTSNTNTTAEVWAAAMSQSENSDEVKKKRKKKLTVWEEKMAEMEAIQSMIDDTQVEEQERGIIREFFDNMSKLKKLRQQLKQLKEQKDYYKKLLAQEKNRPQSGS